MHPESEFRLQHRAARLRPERIELVKSAVESGAFNRLEPHHQFVLTGRYLQPDDRPLTQEALAARLYGVQHARDKRAIVSGVEDTAFKQLKRLMDEGK